MRVAVVLALLAGCSTDGGGAAADLASPIIDLSAAVDLESRAIDLPAPDMTFVCASSPGDTPTCAGGPACDPGCWCALQENIIPFDGGGGTRAPSSRRCACGSDISILMQGMNVGTDPVCCAGQVCVGNFAQDVMCTASGDCYGPAPP